MALRNYRQSTIQ